MFTNTDKHPNSDNVILSSLAANWSERVAVRQERLDLDQYYDPQVPDFPVEMVPFWHDPDFAEVSADARARLLAAAWISYNEKTIYIEDRIINPLCALLLVDQLPGVNDPTIKQVLAQTQVDEQFHILMCLEVCSCARRRHNMQNFVVPEPLLGRRVTAALDRAADERDYALMRMAYGTVAEMTINAYLKQLSADTTIQPLNRLNTELHRRDEASHAAIFGEIARSVYRVLDTADKLRLSDHILRALNDFVEIDLIFWESILDYLNIPNRSQIMARMKAGSRGNRASRDYTAFLNLADSLGIREDIESFFV